MTAALTSIANESRHSNHPLVGPSLELLQQRILVIGLPFVQGDDQENWKGRSTDHED